MIAICKSGYSEPDGPEHPQMAEDDPSSLSPNAAIRTGEHHYKMRPHSDARRAAIRRFATPSLMFMRWKRELIELLLT